MKRKFIYAITLIVGLSLFSFYAKAQNWQAYKGVWLKGYDNAAQAPVPPSGYSALTYFADSLGTYVYDWDSLAWLRIPGAGGGGSAGLTTASNGLNVNPAGNVKLGGTLTENTNILGAGNILNITNSSGSDNGLFEVRPTQIRSQVSSPSSQLTETAQDDAYSLVMTDNASYSNTFSISPTTMRFLRSGSSFTYAGEITLGSSGITLAHGLANGRGLTFNGTTTNRVYRMSSDLNNSIDFNFANSGQSRITTTDRLIINGGTVEMPAITENTNLTDSVMMLDGNGRIFWKTISGGGGGMTADNGLNVDPAGNIRIGTASLPGFVEDDGAVFSTDSLNIAGSHFWFMPDSVQIGNFADLGEGPVTAYLLMKGGLLSGHTPTSSFQLQPGGTNTMSIFWGTAPLFSFGSTRLRFGSASLAPAVRFFEVANGDLLQYTSSIGSDMAFQTMDGATGTESTGDILIRTGAVTSGTGAVGNIEIRLGSQAGSGSGGTLQLDPSTGFLTIVNIPTADPCGSAPTGTVWSDSGTLKVCP